MKIETIRNNKKILLITVISFAVILTLILTMSLAKYKVTQSIKIAEGTINYSPSDFSLMGIYIESDSGYVSADTVPESGYVLNETESYCKIGDTVQDVTISYDANTKTLNIAPMTTKGMKCFLYFDEHNPYAAKDTILANINTITTRSSFSSVYTSSTTGTIFTAEDDDGTSYYYAGAPTDNWVKFGGFYWRIIRINGDGSIRLIYQGTKANTTGTGTQLSSESAFNSSSNNNMYVGYMYTSGQVHGLGTNSTIKGVLDKWYDDNLTSFSNYIDTNVGFCGDRTSYTNTAGTTSGGGTGTTTTYYGAYIRLSTNKSPSLKCTNSSDLYTLSSSNKGNKALSKPIGLITADEVAYAGGLYGALNTNEYYYLYTGQVFWTLSPHQFKNSSTYDFIIDFFGCINVDNISDPYGVRPVINLRADVTLSGAGTSGNPYLVS